jgi:DNA-binding winged helix-turn-helix (wHTH) protein
MAIASGAAGPKVLKIPWTMAQGFVKVRENDGIRFGPFEFDVANRLLYREGVEIWLPPRAIGVLVCLLSRAGQVVSKQDLLDDVWKDASVSETSLTEAISVLRQTLRDDPQRPTFIQTIPRRGYRFVAAEPRGAAPGAAAASLALGDAIAGLAGTGAAADTPTAGTTATASASVNQPANLTANGDVEVWPAWLSWTLLVVCLGALVIVSITASQQPSTRIRPIVRFTMDLPPGLTLDPAAPVALARNGQRVAFAAIRGDGVRQLFVRDFDQLEPAALAGTAGATAPFFSPDARWVGFFADGKLKKLALTGSNAGSNVASAAVAGTLSATGTSRDAGSGTRERVTTLCDAPHAFGATWTDDGTIVFAASWNGGLQRVSADGGLPSPLTTPDPTMGEVRHAWPDVVPESNAVVFAGLPPNGAPEAARVAVVSLASGEVRTLIDAATFPRFLSTGHLLFAREHAIFAAPIDAATFELLGPANPVLDHVRIDARTGAAHFAVAQAGSLAFTPADDSEAADAFRWLDRTETFLLPVPSRAIRAFAVSADATRMAAAVGDDHRTDIWLHDLTAGKTTRLTSSGQNVEPIWSPDGARVLFSARRDGPFNLYAKDLALPSATRLTESPHNQFPCSASAAGLVYVDQSPDTGADLWLLPWNGGPPRVLINSPANEVFGAFSEDGHWFAYQTFLRGTWMLMLRASGPGTASRTNATNNVTNVTNPANVANAAVAANGSAADAAPMPLGPTDGGRIEWAGSDDLYFTRDGHLMSIRLSRPGDAPRPVADVRAPNAFARAARDGRVLLMTAPPQPPPSHVEMVLEWTRELTAKVPVRTPPPRPLR